MSKNVLIIVINMITIIGLLLLPWYIFGGKIFIGGDDSRLLYIYPWNWLINIAFYSWFHFSSVGSNNPNQTLLPFVSIWSLIALMAQSKVLLDYLSFSAPLILGLIYFQLLLPELFENKNENRFIFYVGTLIYILSPIVATNQLSIFLYSAWLIGLLPIISYYFIRYIKTGKIDYIVLNVVWCIFLSLAISTIPWFLGFLLPSFAGILALLPFFKKRAIFVFIKRSLIFFGTLVISQAFWVYSFVINILFSDKNSFLGNVLSSQTKGSFAPTVLATASGDIFYPLLNLSHRQITIDYNSQLRDVFLSFYDKTILFDLIFVIVLFLGIFNIKKYFTGNEMKYRVGILVSFLVSLFLFTVNIGPLKYGFILLGNIPGFVMFRNFYDKFALSYAFIYAVFLSLCLVIIMRKFKKWGSIFLVVTLVAVIINLIPIKEVINKPIWTTRSVYTAVTVPNEYLDFMEQIKQKVPSSANMLSIPFNIAGYTMIKDTTSNNIFAGRSPVQLFSGVNDFSGNLSFSPRDVDLFNGYIISRDYKDLNIFLVHHNIGYIFLTRNIPQEVRKSYLFDQKVESLQDQQFITAVTSQKLLQSRNGNYVLYKSKYPTSAFATNISFTKINPVTFRLYLHNIKTPQNLIFLDSYSSGWKLYPEKYSASLSSSSFFSINELQYNFTKPLFDNTHIVVNNYANAWIINPQTIKNTLPLDDYHINSDGSIDAVLTLYFTPQTNFYIGTLITLATLLVLFGILIYSRAKKTI